MAILYCRFLNWCKVLPSELGTCGRACEKKCHRDDRITCQKNSKKDRGHIKLPKVIISPPRLLVKNADRRAELTGQGGKLTLRAHSPVHR